MTPHPPGGTNLTTGAPTVDDAWLDAPHGVTAGGAAPLRATLVNTTHEPGLALTAVTSPAIRGAVLRQSGRDVHEIRVPTDGNAVDLEWSGLSGITLVGVRHSLRAGSYLPITLHYSNGTSQSLQVVAGPLGGGSRRGSHLRPPPRPGGSQVLGRQPDLRCEHSPRGTAQRRCGMFTIENHAKVRIGPTPQSAGSRRS